MTSLGRICGESSSYHGTKWYCFVYYQGRYTDETARWKYPNRIKMICVFVRSEEYSYADC